MKRIYRKTDKPGVADIIRRHGGQYAKNNPLLPEQLHAMASITRCRTQALGGNIFECEDCGTKTSVYYSCCNRHCPKCQALAKARWLEARDAELLPVTYFHNVFTLPHELNPWIRHNKKPIYDILFQSVSRTLLEFGADTENGLGGRLGFLAVLHSWDQRLLEHHHLHCIIPGGALSFDGKTWIESESRYLFPVKALSIVFRGKFTDSLEKAFNGGKITSPTGKDFKQLLAKLRNVRWVVYSKPSFAGLEKVLDYLARYSHRVAISNNRVKKFENGEVTFSYKDRKNGNRKKEATIPAEEFIRRFLSHVLPDRYMKIRYFGFLGNRHKKENITLIRTLLDVPAKQEMRRKSLRNFFLNSPAKTSPSAPSAKPEP